MLKAITVISNNQNEFEQKLEQKVATKNEPSEQSPVNIFRPHYPQQVYRQGYRQNFRPLYQNYQPNYQQYQTSYHQFQTNNRPQQQYALVLKINESLDHNLTLLDHFITMNSNKFGIIGPNLQIAPHLFAQLMFLDQFIGSQQNKPLQNILDRE